MRFHYYYIFLFVLLGTVDYSITIYKFQSRSERWNIIEHFKIGVSVHFTQTLKYEIPKEKRKPVLRILRKCLAQWSDWLYCAMCGKFHTKISSTYRGLWWLLDSYKRLANRFSGTVSSMCMMAFERLAASRKFQTYESSRRNSIYFWIHVEKLLFKFVQMSFTDCIDSDSHASNDYGIWFWT